MRFLQRGEHSVVQDQARAAHPCDDTPNDVAGGATRSRHDHGETVRRERLLERRLVVVDEHATGHRHPGGDEHRVHRRGGVTARARADRHQPHRAHGQLSSARAARSSSSA